MSTILFADDTNVLFKNKSLENLIISSTNEFIEYREWRITNRLFFKRKQNSRYDFHNQTHTTSTSNCLSPTNSLDNKLKFNKDIQIIGKRNWQIDWYYL